MTTPLTDYVYALRSVRKATPEPENPLAAHPVVDMNCTIRMTRAQADQARWALDGMQDGGCQSRIDGFFLNLIGEDEVTDMLYRLEEQLQDMARDERGYEGLDGCAGKAMGDARAAFNLARKIRGVTGYTGRAL